MGFLRDGEGRINLTEAVMRADSWINEKTGFGVFGKDIMEAFEVQALQTISLQEARTLYRDNIYAARIIDELPESALRHGWHITGADSDLLEEAYKRFKIESKIQRAASLARRDRDAWIWILTTEDAEAQATPLRLDGSLTLQNFVVLDCEQATVSDWGSPLEEGEDGEPTLYWVHPGDGNSFKVHASRMIPFVGRERLSIVEKMRHGGNDSVLHAARGQLKRWNIAEKSFGHLVNELKVSIIKTNRKDGKTDRKRLTNIATIKSLLGMINIGTDEDFAQTSVNLSGFKDLVQALAYGLTGAGRMSLTRMLGAQPPGLSTDDQAGARNWADQRTSYQTKQLTRALERIHEALFAAWNVTTSHTSGWRVEWPSPDEERSQEDERLDRAERVVKIAKELKAVGLTVEQILGALVQDGEWTPGTPSAELSFVSPETPPQPVAGDNIL